MPVFEAVRLALQTIRAQKLKSGFSLLGVFIGVASPVGAWRRRPRIKFSDAEAVTAAITGPVITAWESDDNVSVFYGGKEARDISLTAASERYFEIKNLRIATGRAFTAQENRSGAPVAVLGEDVAKRLFSDRDPIDHRVRIGGIGYRVI